MCRLLTATVMMAAVAAPAFGAQDRYGPPRLAMTPVAGSAAQDARPEALAPWAKRLIGAAPAAAEPRAPHRPEPLAPWAVRQSGAAPVAAIQTPPMAQRPQPLAPQPLAPRPLAMTPVPQPSAGFPATAAPLAMREAARPTALAPGATAGPRFYSVSRQYGAQPDAIPVAAPARGQVLTLAETPMTQQMSRGSGDQDDIPVSETKRNAAATRTSRQGL